MTTRVVALAVACAAALFPAASAWAQVEHAQRLALEVAIRRAQVRTTLCDQPRPPPVVRGTAADLSRLPSSPPIGTAGPVDCSRPAWPNPLGR